MSFRSLFEEIKHRGGFQTDEEFATAIHVSRATLNGILNGKPASCKIIAAALQALKMNLGDLQLPAEDPVLEEERILLRSFRYLKHATFRRNVLELLEGLVLGQKQLTAKERKGIRK